MKALLTAIQTQLRTDLTYIRDSDIYIAPHENYIPGQVRPPCVGIKDGAIVRKELVSSMLEVTLNVTIIIMVQLAKDEASIMGDTASSKKGVLDIAEDVHAALDENFLDITGMQEAYSPAEEGSVMFGDEKEALQRKLITYQYIREGLRP